jgi:hypothetical protein
LRIFFKKQEHAEYTEIHFHAMTKNEAQDAQKKVPDEIEKLENIRSLTGDERLSVARKKALRDSLVGRSNWSFMLPSGHNLGRGGLTANCFNLRFGPFALRVSTKSEEELQKQLFRLAEMMRHPNNLEKMREDQTWENEAEALGEMCRQLCGADKDLESGEQTIKKWNVPQDVKFHSSVVSFLGKVWVYVGNGDNIQVDRIYIRDKLMDWVEGKVPTSDRFSEEGLEETGLASLKLALHPFDIWVPCEMLDDCCCLSDIPGVCECILLCSSSC